MKFKSIKILDQGLMVTFNNSESDCYPFIWLRDHAQDETSWDSRSNQRKIFTADIDPLISVDKVNLADDKDKIYIRWPDLTFDVEYTCDFLFNNMQDSIKKEKIKKINWDRITINNYDIDLDFSSLKDRKGIQKLLNNLLKFGFCVLNLCPAEMESVEYITNKIGYVRNSIFGGLWSFESNSNMADSAYTQEELRPHTDGTYNHDAPGLQLLLCCEYDAKGGESIMVDGLKLAEIIKKTDKESYSSLTTVEVPGAYIGDGVYLEAKRPIFKINHEKEITQVSFNNYDRSIFRLPNDETNKFYKANRTFDKLANNRDLQWRQILKPGQLLIFDNWRILHGRGEFKGTRKMSGCYINREDFESSCRMHNIN